MDRNNHTNLGRKEEKLWRQNIITDCLDRETREDKKEVKITNGKRV
jgi:hypothetical protein